eukprot:scaffold194617_cov26-Tisochrysis_lutea.AAC.1
MGGPGPPHTSRRQHALATAIGLAINELNPSYDWLEVSSYVEFARRKMQLSSYELSAAMMFAQ